MGKLVRSHSSAVIAIITGWLLALSVTSCTPTIQIAPPSEPITINLNIKIEHEIRIKVDKELDDLFESEGDIF